LSVLPPQSNAGSDQRIGAGICISSSTGFSLCGSDFGLNEAHEEDPKKKPHRLNSLYGFDLRPAPVSAFFGKFGITGAENHTG